MFCLFDDNWYCSLVNSVRRFWRTKVKRPIRNIIRIIKWIPIVWKTDWWDYIYLTDLLAFKLKEDAKKYECCGNAINNKKQAREMRRVAAALDRIGKNDYQYWFSMKITGENFYDMEFHYDAFGIWHGESQLEYDSYMRQQDLDYVLKMLRKHLFTWWD